MSILERGNDRPFGIARRMSDGSVAVPKIGGIVDRGRLENGKHEIVTKSLGPAEIHARAVLEEQISAMQYQQRILSEGKLESIVGSAK